MQGYDYSGFQTTDGQGENLASGIYTEGETPPEEENKSDRWLFLLLLLLILLFLGLVAGTTWLHINGNGETETPQFDDFYPPSGGSGGEDDSGARSRTTTRRPCTAQEFKILRDSINDIFSRNEYTYPEDSKVEYHNYTYSYHQFITTQIEEAYETSSGVEIRFKTDALHSNCTVTSKKDNKNYTACGNCNLEGLIGLRRTDKQIKPPIEIYTNLLKLSECRYVRVTHGTCEDCKEMYLQGACYNPMLDLLFNNLWGRILLFNITKIPCLSE